MKISVIIISYNQKDYLKEALASVLNQTARPFEIIVCDDASQDGSQDLIKQYEKNYAGLVRGIYHQINGGISKNRNSGLLAAQGDLVTWLDGDDLFMPRKLELELQQFRKGKEVKWVYSQVAIKDEIKSQTRLRYKNFYDGIILPQIIPMLGTAPRNPLVELKALRKTGFFDEDMTMYEDFALCMRLAKHYKCAFCREPLMVYRVHAGGIHKTAFDKHLQNLDKLHEKGRQLLAGEPWRLNALLDSKIRKTKRLFRFKKALEEKEYGQVLLISGQECVSTLLHMIRYHFHRLSKERTSKPCDV